MLKLKIQRVAVLTLTSLVWLALTLASATVAAQESLSAAQRDELEAQLDEARQQLDEAAARLGELHGELYAMETIGHHGQKPMLGVLLGENGATGGIELVGVTPGSGAQAAGLAAGDELTLVNGVDLTSAQSAISALKDAMQGVESGQSVAVGYLRDGSFVMADVTTHARGIYIMGMTGAPDVDVDIDVEALENMATHLADKFSDVDFSAEWVESLQALENLESLESLQALSTIGPQIGMAVTRAIKVDGGLRLENVHEDLGQYFGVNDGVLVISVPLRDEAADEVSMGLKAGDIILAIDGENVSDAGAAYRALFGADATASVEVLRHGSTELVEVSNLMGHNRTITIRSGHADDLDVRVISPDSP